MVSGVVGIVRFSFILFQKIYIEPVIMIFFIDLLLEKKKHHTILAINACIIYFTI